MTDERKSAWPGELGLDDAPGPAAYQSAAGRDAMVQRVLDGAGFGAAPARKRWATRWVVAAALIACIGGGSASAAVLWYLRTTHEPAVQVGPPKVPSTRTERTERVEPAQLEQPVPAPAKAVEVEPRTRAPHADWFREANRLRRAKRWKQADEAYGLAAQHASSAEAAYVAHVASAGVRLEQLRDPRGALARYRAALQSSPRGALDEEIRLGIADAYRALGDREREREALHDFLRAHPSSPLAEQARARLP